MKKSIFICVLLFCCLLIYRKDVYASTTVEVEGTRIIPCKNGNFFVEKDGKFALYNRNGLLITDFIYDNLNSDTGSGTMNENIDLVFAEKDNKWGMIDINGNELLPFIYEDLGHGDAYCSDYDGLIGCELGGKRGLLYSNGDVLIEPRYDSIHRIMNNLFEVELDGKFGVIDRTGKEILKTQYDEINIGLDELILIKQNKKWGLYNISKGKMVIDFHYDSMDFTYVNVDETKAKFDVLLIVSVDGKYGIIDKNGTIIAPLQYDYIKKNQVEYGNQNIDDYFIIKQNAYFGVVNTSGKIIIKPQYDSINISVDGLTVVKKNNKYGVVNNKGNIVAKIKYDSVMDINQGLIVVKDMGKYGVIDKKGKVTIPLKYEYAYPVSSNSVIVKKNGKYGIIDNKNKVIVKIDNDNISPFDNTDLLRVERNGKIGVKTSNGKIVLRPIYSSINADSLGIKKILKDYRFIKDIGILGENSYNIFLNHMESFGEGIFALKKNELEVYNKNGKVLFKAAGKYKKAYIYNNLLYFIKDNKVGYINMN